MSLQQIIRECLPEKKYDDYANDPFIAYKVGYNRALTDIEAKIPEIEKKVVEEIRKDLNHWDGCAIEIQNKIINLLTKE